MDSFDLLSRPHQCVTPRLTDFQELAYQHGVRINWKVFVIHIRQKAADSAAQHLLLLPVSRKGHNGDRRGCGIVFVS